MTVGASITDITELLAGSRDPSAFFHMVNRLIPLDQDPLTVPLTTTVRDALELMRVECFSQLPVVDDGRVWGVFTHRAFALELVNGRQLKGDPGDRTVEEFLDHERVVYARHDEDFTTLFDKLDACDVVVVSGPEDLIGLLTPMDVVRYLHEVTDAFVLVQEIELALRTLIRLGLPDAEELRACAERALSHYEGGPPTSLEEWTFGDCVSLVRYRNSWSHLAPVFGGSRDRVAGHLGPLPELRNTVLHFKRELSSDERALLRARRKWLKRRVELAERGIGT